MRRHDRSKRRAARDLPDRVYYPSALLELIGCWRRGNGAVVCIPGDDLEVAVTE